MSETPAAPKDEVPCEEHGDAPNATPHGGTAPDPACGKRNVVAVVTRPAVVRVTPISMGHGTGVTGFSHLHMGYAFFLKR